MKKLVVLLLGSIICLLCNGCGEGSKRVEYLHFESLDVFIEKFKEVFPFPTYYPEGFSPDDPGVTIVTTGTISREAFKKQPKKGYGDYEGIDVFAAASFEISRESSNHEDYWLESISIGKVLDKRTEPSSLSPESLPNSIIYYVGDVEIIETSEKFYNAETETWEEDHSKEHVIAINVRYPLYTNSDEYYLHGFYFLFFISPTAHENEYLTIREKLREFCIDEAMQMFESLEYKK